MASQRLQAFTARCRVADATTAAERATHQAAYLAQWRRLAPKLPTSADSRRLVLRWLGTLALLLGIGLLWRGPTHSLSLEPTPRGAWHRLAR